MNLKITQDQHEILEDYVTDTIQFGNPDGEDTDLLHLVQPNVQMDNTLIDNKHTLFFKDEKNNVDHLYVTPQGFIKSLLTGGSTLFVELLEQGKLKGTALDYLYKVKVKDLTHNYKTLKAFIGCAERDFRQARVHKDRDKKLKWSLEYLNKVRGSLGLSMYNLVDASGLILTRRELNRVKDNKELPFSVSVEIYHRLQTKLNLERKLDLYMLDSLNSTLFKNWSEDY